MTLRPRFRHSLAELRPGAQRRIAGRPVSASVRRCRKSPAAPWFIAIVVAILTLLILLLVRCTRPQPVAVAPVPDTIAPAVPATAQSSAPVSGAPEPAEVLTPATLQAAGQVVANAEFPVTWTGPANHGDYITAVAAATRDGQYGNYTTVNKGSPLDVTMLMETGDAELRYMTGCGAQVLARRAIRVVAAEITLDAPASAAAGAPVSVKWTGPSNAGDYLTIVTKDTPDGQYGAYTLTNRGSPLTVNASKTAGEAELRYMSGIPHGVSPLNAILGARAVGVFGDLSQRTLQSTA